MKLSVCRITFGAFLASFVALATPSAHAGWGSLGGSYGSVGGGSVGGGSYGGSSGYVAAYGSNGGSAGYGSAGASFTPVRSLLRGIHDHIAAKVERHQARRAAYASYGSTGYASSGYGSGGYASSGHGSTGYSVGYGSTGYGSQGSSVSYGSVGSGVSYGSVGSSVSYGSTGSVVAPSSYGSTDGTIYYGASNTSQSNSLISAVQHADDDAVYLTVSLPTSARVLVNGKTTSSTGSVRQFVSRGLVPGKTYKFEVRAEMDAADGQVLTEEKTVVVNAGSQEQLQFAFSDSAAPVETMLTLNVPEGAKVVLAGSSTRASGTQRVYQSKQLKVGEVWDDYQVEVELDGQVKRQSIRLIGGDSLELTFDFDAQSVDQLASVR